MGKMAQSTYENEETQAQFVEITQEIAKLEQTRAQTKKDAQAMVQVIDEKLEKRNKDLRSFLRNNPIGG